MKAATIVSSPADRLAPARLSSGKKFRNFCWRNFYPRSEEIKISRSSAELEQGNSHIIKDFQKMLMLAQRIAKHRPREVALSACWLIAESESQVHSQESLSTASAMVKLLVDAGWEGELISARHLLAKCSNWAEPHTKAQEITSRRHAIFDAMLQKHKGEKDSKKSGAGAFLQTGKN